MIVELIINFLLSVISGIIGTLSPAPDSFGSGFEEAWTMISNSYGAILYMMPTDISLTVNLIVGIIVSFELGYLLFYLGEKIYKWIRG